MHRGFQIPPSPSPASGACLHGKTVGDATIYLASYPVCATRRSYFSGLAHNVDGASHEMNVGHANYFGQRTNVVHNVVRTIANQSIYCRDPNASWLGGGGEILLCAKVKLSDSMPCARRFPAHSSLRHGHHVVPYGAFHKPEGKATTALAHFDFVVSERKRQLRQTSDESHPSLPSLPQQ